jgi:hypothetical protein
MLILYLVIKCLHIIPQSSHVSHCYSCLLFLIIFLAHDLINKTDITEILLKVALNTINQTKPYFYFNIFLTNRNMDLSHDFTVKWKTHFHRKTFFFFLYLPLLRSTFFRWGCFVVMFLFSTYGKKASMFLCKDTFLIFL